MVVGDRARDESFSDRYEMIDAKDKCGKRMSLLCCPRRSMLYTTAAEVELAIEPWRCAEIPGGARVYSQTAARIQWLDAGGAQIGIGPSAPPLTPGRYAARIAPNDGSPQFTLCFRIEEERLPVVVSYITRDASSETGWDGSVTARISHAPAHSRYLWSNGANTTTPELKDLRPGRYTCAIVDEHGRQLPFVHAAPAAEVTFTV